VKRAARVFRFVCSSPGRVERLHGFEQDTLVSGALIGDPHFELLTALKACTGIEVFAVTTRVQGRRATRTRRCMIHFQLARRHLMATIRAPGDHNGLSVNRVSQRSSLFSITKIGRSLDLLTLTTVFVVVVIPVTALTILHPDIPPPTAKTASFETVGIER
jgi:hypothetical protein